MQIVQRRILEQQDSRRHFDAAEQDVGGRASSRPIRLPIVKRGRDVIVATQHIEVVLVVEIQWRLCPHPFPHGIRIIIDAVVERVVVQLDRLITGH